MHNTLIVVVGPTGIGKTSLSIALAQHFKSQIISADSRQIFKEIKIGTAAPTEMELAAATHHLVATQSVSDYYSAWEFEQDVLKLTETLFMQCNPLVMVGGAMMYVDAVCKGIDDLPTIDQNLRDEVFKQYEEIGLEGMRRQLKQLDPVFYEQVDLKNAKRVIHAVEICLMTGMPYSSLRTNPNKERPFKIIKIGLDIPREELYQRINLRVDQMIENGLVDEVKGLQHLKHLNSLNTVGYKEIFSYLDGEITLPDAIELIKRNSRRYAKKQLTWFRKDVSTTWFHPSQRDEIIAFLDNALK